MSTNSSPRPHREFPSIEPLEARIAPAVIIVNSLMDTNVSGKTDLRQALAQADADLAMHPGVVNTIKFDLPAAAARTENAITLTAGVLTSNGDVNIVGPGAGKLIVSGGGNSQVFKFGSTTATVDSPVSISGLSIIDGMVSTGGAGVYSSDSLTLKGVVISGNTSTTSPTGAFAVDVHGNATAGTKVSISNSLISGNTGMGAGGVGLYGVKSFAITNTELIGNTISAGGGGGIFASVNATGTGGTITGCLISGNSAGYAAGVHIADANPAASSKITISGSIITGNITTGTASDGGGVDITAGNAVIIGCVIDNNSTLYDGGGIFANGAASLTISKSTISGNKTTKTNAGNQGGGGVCIYGQMGTALPVTITGSHITDNTAALDGGGIFAIHDVALSIAGSTFSGNEAQGSGIGGGIATVGNGATNQVNLTVIGSVFTGNSTANNGGAICGQGGGASSSGTGSITLIASKFIGNSAAGEGGGIDASTSGAVMMKNDIVADNFTGAFGGGVAIQITQNLLITGGAFDGNTSASSGGGLWFNGAKGTVQDATITGNAAAQAGGGVKTDFGASMLTFKADHLFANTAPDGPDVANFSGTITFT